MKDTETYITIILAFSPQADGFGEEPQLFYGPEIAATSFEDADREREAAGLEYCQVVAKKVGGGVVLEDGSLGFEVAFRPGFWGQFLKEITQKI